MKLTPRWGSLPWALSSSFPAPLELPTGYYLEHFLILLDTVESRYGDLLDQKEREFLTTFHGLSLPAQRLYVRLVSRKGPVFRSDRLSYPEIPDLEETWLVLASEGFLTVNDPQCVGEAAALLTVSELRDLGKELGLAIPQTTRKAEVLEMLHEQVPAEKRLSLFSGMFHWLCPSFQDVLRVFRLFFSGPPSRI